MDIKFYFSDDLFEELFEAKKSKNILNFNQNIKSSALQVELRKLNELDKVHSGIKEVYSQKFDGWEFYWYKDKTKAIGGSIQLAQTKYMFANQKEYGFYDDYDLAKIPDIQYFQPLDYMIDGNEDCCGFIIKPNEIYKSIYYYNLDRDLCSLDLDFESYTQMALASRVFNNWQRVLLDYEDPDSRETHVFKEEMAKLFPDWTWKGFIEKYESLRLSNK